MQSSTRSKTSDQQRDFGAGAQGRRFHSTPM